jgi:hypothetical protein
VAGGKACQTLKNRDAAIHPEISPASQKLI